MGSLPLMSYGPLLGDPRVLELTVPQGLRADQDSVRNTRSRLTADLNRSASSRANSQLRQRMAKSIAFSRGSGISASHSVQLP